VKAPHWLALAVAFGVIGYVLTQMLGQDPTGGFNQPPMQPAADDDVARVKTYQDHLCHPAEHWHGYTFTPHRYPKHCGGEITNTIHKGFSSMRVPASQDVQWLIAPPSEVMF
jgi:hypothetical protein